jgi:hypothetical protein
MSMLMQFDAAEGLGISVDEIRTAVAQREAFSAMRRRMMENFGWPETDVNSSF